MLVNIALSCLCCIVAAQAGFKFEALHIDHEPYNHTTTVVHQDSRGFMWFGGYRGLRRFDGYEATAYLHDPSNPFSLGDNKINNIHENSKSDLWICTQNGLNFFDRSKNKFTRYLANQDGTFVWVTQAEEDHEGKVWFSTLRKGLGYLDPQSNSVSYYTLNQDHIQPAFNSFVADESNIWIASQAGLIRKPRMLDTLIHLLPSASLSISNRFDVILDIEIFNDTVMILGTSGGCLLSDMDGTFSIPNWQNQLQESPIINYISKIGRTVWMSTYPPRIVSPGHGEPQHK